MATIIEDYVSFEIAKLLKEKGFDEKCRTYYKVFPESRIAAIYHSSENRGVSEDDSNEILCPTLQMAIKWLRLKHNIYINVNLSFTEDQEAYPAVYYVYILDTKLGNSLLEKAAHIGELNPLMDVNNHNVPINFDSPEEAANVAIKYCLENLI